MTANEDHCLPAVPDRQLDESSIIEEVLNADIEEAQPLIHRHLTALEPHRRESDLGLFLQSFWDHLEGVRFARQDGDFERAAQLQDSAAAGFEQLGIDELESVCRAMSAYSCAVIECHHLNINRGLELLTATEAYLRDAGRFATKFRPLIDHMKPESLFVGVVHALMVGDVSSARVLVSQASGMAKKVAERYYEEGSAPHCTFLGLAHYYQAFFSCFCAERGLSNFELDRILSEDNSMHAKEAERLFARADLANLQIQNVHNISKAIVEILEVTKGIATRMQRCFAATFKPDVKGFVELRAMTRRAIDHASNAGPGAVALVRVWEQHFARIDNLERLARPRKSDFGIFSGLVSAALFVPLLVIGSWTSKAFGMEFGGTTFFMTIVVLSLIGGFGFGAMRFRNWLSSLGRSSRATEGSKENRP